MSTLFYKYVPIFGGLQSCSILNTIGLELTLGTGLFGIGLTNISPGS